MFFKNFISTALLTALSTSAVYAGGIVTNTNQSVDFLRNPARDGAIAIGGVYYNPAGVVFLKEGFHIGVSLQSAWQTRTATTTNPLFALGVNNNGAVTKEYEGKANAPVIPSLQAAYNTKKWSFQLNMALNGGGGKATFDSGLGSFESAVAQIAHALKPFGAKGYDAVSFMQGRQYYLGMTLGAAYKLTDNLSVYGGLRLLYGNASYKAKVSDIRVDTDKGLVNFGDFIDEINLNYKKLKGMHESLGNSMPDAYRKAYEQMSAAMPQITELEVYRNGVNLQSDQHGLGLAPILGVDYKIGSFNFAAKYEFRTKMSMKNKSTVNEAMAIEEVNQFLDGSSVREDSPSLITLGAQWEVLPKVRLNAGYHHFFDKDAPKYNGKEKKLKHGANEYLGGVEWDATNRLTVSGGVQITNYGMSDAYMSDLSFVVDSWSFGLGAKYKVSEKVAVNAAYFQTNYGKYTTEMKNGVQNMFTRSNNVVGVGVELDF
jgi:long-chain fatty acid transport protein